MEELISSLGPAGAAVAVVWMFIADRSKQRDFDKERDDKFVHAIEQNSELTQKGTEATIKNTSVSRELHSFMKKLNGRLDGAISETAKERQK